jgi:transcriptional regulator with XRE-family HTH domain
VSRLRDFGGGFVPPSVAREIEFRRRQRGLSQRELGKLIGRSQGQLANALRGHDPVSAFVVNRLREVLLGGVSADDRCASVAAGQADAFLSN